MTAAIRQYRIQRFEIPLSRVIGAWNMRSSHLWLGALTLVDDSGTQGLGFFISLSRPLPSLKTLEDHFQRMCWPELDAGIPESLVHRIKGARPTDYNIDNAIDQALWDLAAKRCGVPLYQFLGGTVTRVPAYASGLCFHLSDNEYQHFYATAWTQGYRAFKIKLAHPDLAWDLRRLALLTEVVGQTARIMVDANDAWDVAEARHRLASYGRAGYIVDWIEDPLPRQDFAGLRALHGAMGGARVNAGENLDARQKTHLIMAGGADIINTNDLIDDGLHVGWLTYQLGLRITLGNSVMNIGAHLASALPHVDLVEDSQLDWTRLLADPLPVEDGHFVISSRPGHGLDLSPDAAREYQRD